MNPGTIVDGLSVGGNKAGLELQKAGGRKPSTAQAPITGAVSSQNARTGGDSGPRNWSQEFAEQTGLLAGETDSVNSLDSLDPASKIDPPSNSGSMQEASQLLPSKSFTKLQSGYEVQAQVSHAVDEVDASASSGAREGRLPTRNHANGFNSSDGPRESRSRSEAEVSSSVSRGAVENSHHATLVPSDPNLQFANLPLSGYGWTNLLLAQNEWGSGSGVVSRDQASQSQGSQVETGKQSVVGDIGRLAPHRDADAIGTDRSKTGLSSDLSISPIGGIGTDMQRAAGSIGLTSLHQASDLAGLSSNDSNDSSGASLADVGQGNGPMAASLNRQTIAAQKASEASNVPPTSLSSNAIEGSARGSIVPGGSGAAKAAEQAASDPGGKIRGNAGTLAGAHERAKPDDSAASVGSTNSSLHASVPNPSSANSATHPGGAGALMIASGSHPLPDSAGLEPGATGLGQISGPGSADMFHSGSAIGSNPFVAMDAGHGAAVEQSSSEADQLTVGHQDPVLGYVELRAHADGSGVHASLGVQSTAAGETLEGHLSSLASWMNERHTPVESIRVLSLDSEHAQGATFHGKDSEANGSTGENGTGAQSGFGSSGDGSGASQQRRSGGSHELPVMTISVPAGVTGSHSIHVSEVVSAGVNGKSISVVV